ncbi:hypothetical protein D3C84_777620 [compost metagenome]
MAPGQSRIGYTPDALIIRFNPAVIRVGCQGKPAMAYESQGPGPVRHAEIAISPGCADLIKQLIGHKPTAQGHADQVLDQHIQGFMGGVSRFDPALRYCILCRRGFDQLQAVGRHQGHP